MNELIKRYISEYMDMLPKEDYDKINLDMKPTNHMIKDIIEKSDPYLNLFENEKFNSILIELRNKRFSSSANIKEMDILLESLMKLFIDLIRTKKTVNNFQYIVNLIVFTTFDYPIRAIGALRVHTCIQSNLFSDDDLELLNMDGLFNKCDDYIQSIRNILTHDFTSYDIQLINNIMHRIESLAKPCPIHCIRNILLWYFPRMIDIDNETGDFIDVMDKIKYAPSEDDTVLEHASSFSMVGKIDFSKYSVNESSDLLSKIRIKPSNFPSNVNYVPSFEYVGELKSELGVEIEQIAYLEAGNPEYRTIMEYNDDLFVLYEDGEKSEDGFDLIKGYSLVKEKSRDQKLFEYEVDKKDSPYIKAFNF